MKFNTAYPDERTRAAALAAGALVFLTKPFREDDLLQSLRTVLQSDPRRAF